MTTAGQSGDVKPRVVKLGDASTWAIKPHVDSAGASGSVPKAPAPLPAPQPRVFGPRKAWPESKLTVKYPHGYDPVTKTLAPGKTGPDDKDLESKKKRAERFGLPGPKEEAPSTEAQEVLSAVDKELEAKRRRAEKFGLVQPAAAAAPVDPNDPLAQYTVEFLAKKAEQDRLRAQILALRKIKAPDAEDGDEQPGKKQKKRPFSAGAQAGGRGAGGRGGRGGAAAGRGAGNKKFIRQ